MSDNLPIFDSEREMDRLQIAIRRSAREREAAQAAAEKPFDIKHETRRMLPREKAEYLENLRERDYRLYYDSGGADLLLKLRGGADG